LQRINIKPLFQPITAANTPGEAAPSILLAPREALRPTHCPAAATAGRYWWPQAAATSYLNIEVLLLECYIVVVVVVVVVTTSEVS